MNAKGLIIRALAGLRVDALARHIRRRQTLCLAYHNVIPDGPGYDDLGSHHMRESDFRRQIEWLSKEFDVVPLPAILTEREGRPSRPRVAITFDDAYRGALRLATPWLARRGVPATMFVAPGSLGTEGFWWDRLDVAPWDDFARFFEELRGEQDEIMAWATGSGLEIRDLGPDLKPASEAELTSAVEGADGHLLVGPHGWKHENLAALPTAELERALDRPLAWLRDRHPSRTVDILAFPYGLSSERVCDQARIRGHRAGLLINGSWMPRPLGAPFRIPRRNVASGMPLPTFRMLLAR